MDKNNTNRREFRISSFALKNRNTIFFLSFMLILFGFISYISMPKELFPEINNPTIIVQTIYPGNSPEDIENLVTRPLEKEIKLISGIKNINSNSVQDASMIFVEFTTDTDVKEALADVKDAVDNAQSELPDDLMEDPMVQDFDFSQFPILNVNISGDFNFIDLQSYAEYLQDEFETIYEVSKVDIRGLPEREILIEIDLHKMEALGLSFTQIENAIRFENMTMSGGEMKLNGTRRSIRTVGEFKNVDNIRNIIIKTDGLSTVYLKDVADVVDGYEEAKSFSRLLRQNVVSLDVIKKNGENLLTATEEIYRIIEEAQQSGDLPNNLSISITNDQSENTRAQLSNLENSIIMGVILVILVLFFFLGLRNAVLVGLSIPMSMVITFLFLDLQDAQVNMIVLFSMILALGMLVDNAIVVVENINRFIKQGDKIKDAARYAVGEIAQPIISSTLTTLAAFFPLIFWKGMTGEFMKYMPITLIVVLSSSLLVALIIIPVFGVSFIKKEETGKFSSKRKLWYFIGALLLAAVPFYFINIYFLANVLVIIALIMIANVLFLNRMALWFRKVFLVWLEESYLKLLQFALKGRKPYVFFFGVFGLLVLTIMFFGARRGEIRFFPQGDPKYIHIVAEFPLGTDVERSDSLFRIIENDIYEVLEPDMDIIESILTQVGQGVRREKDWAFGDTPHKASIRIQFVEYKERFGKNTSDIMKELSGALLRQYPGVEFSLEKNESGPQTGNPINIEISGKEYPKILSYADSIQSKIENSGIEGIEALNVDVEMGKPELIIEIDRDKAMRFGLSTFTIASTIRTSLFGKEISDYKVGEEKYPIQIRLAPEYRYNLASLLNQKISFVNQASGQFQQIPISAVASFKYTNSIGSVNRKNLKRMVTLYSNVIEGYNATSINAQIADLFSDYQMPEGYELKLTGQQEEQDESSDFMFTAMLIAMALMLIILIGQFNSFFKPIIILVSVVLSTIGVLGGLATFKMDFVIIMTGVGIISLAGVVVNNAIVLVDYVGLLKRNRKKDLEIEEHQSLPVSESDQCIIQAGKTRLRPVLLTAITTILGLLPLAVGMNIDFAQALSAFNPEMYFGGDNSIFWGPLAWTIIFGLSFATLVTLVIVPVMYKIASDVQYRLRAARGKRIKRQEP